MKGYKMGADCGSEAVTAMREIDLQGNVIPMSWFSFVKFPNGKPHANAILILADIVYWYRPVEVRDETTGRTIGYRKKFEGKYLQRSNPDIARQFGFTLKQARDAIECLCDLGVIRRHISQGVINKQGKMMGNVPYIELVVDKLKEITLTPMTYRAEGYALQDTPYTPTGQSNTETTTETTNTDLTDRDANAAPPARPSQLKSLSIELQQPDAVTEESVTPSPDSAPPPPPAKKRARKTNPELFNHPFVAVWRDVFRLNLPEAKMVQLSRIAVTPTALTQWRAACEAWVLRPYDPTNIGGILDWYRDPTRYQSRPSNGRGNYRTPTPPPASPYTAMSEAEKAAYLASCEPMED